MLSIDRLIVEAVDIVGRKSLRVEGSSSKILYHLTDVTATLDIIKNKRFKLSPEEGITGTSMSFATSTKSGYFTLMAGPDSVMLIFDRTVLASELEVQSFKHDSGAKQLASIGVNSNEHEVRIFGTSGFTLFPIRALKQVRILQMKTRSAGTDYYSPQQFDQLTELCASNNIELKLVPSKSEFRKPY